MSKYMTKQREALLSFLAEHTDESFSARQIADELSSAGISVSAVYRNLAALEQNGELKRVVSGNGREVMYRYSGGEHCKSCLHLSCKICGVTSHMSAEGAKMLIKNLEESDGFGVDISDTIIYGICKKCRAAS